MERDSGKGFWPSKDDPVYRPFFAAAETGDIQRLKQLISENPNIRLDALDRKIFDDDFDVQRFEGDRAITKAAANGHTNVIHVLFESGADINAGDADDYYGKGTTALQAATISAHIDTVSALLDKGADPQANKISDSLLKLAIDPGSRVPTISHSRQSTPRHPS